MTAGTGGRADRRPEPASSGWSATVEALQEKGVRLLRMTDPAYPRGASRPAGPAAAALRPRRDRRAGPARGEHGGHHAALGARAAPIAEQFGARFAAAGVTVVSGYAHGIDAASHRGAFKGGGRSILCVPYGIRHFRSRADFPALAEIAQRGAVVSECPPDLEWSAAAAVARAPSTWSSSSCFLARFSNSENTSLIRLASKGCAKSSLFS